jgi:hypothetical protein
MTKEQLAEKLNGRKCMSEITNTESVEAYEAGLVVLFGDSDDNMVLRGAIHGEISCYTGTTLLLTPDGQIMEPRHKERCRCQYCGFSEFAKTAKSIEAVYTDGYSWIYETDIPHATFEIMEDGSKYCRGIVFDLASLKA